MKNMTLNINLICNFVCYYITREINKAQSKGILQAIPVFNILQIFKSKFIFLRNV
jgi:hypothetical protein